MEWMCYKVYGKRLFQEFDRQHPDADQERDAQNQVAVHRQIATFVNVKLPCKLAKVAIPLGLDVVAGYSKIYPTPRHVVCSWYFRAWTKFTLA
jgi:hypothetical protein